MHIETDAGSYFNRVGPGTGPGAIGGSAVTRLMPGSLGSIQEFAHHGEMTTFKRLLRRFDAYTLEAFNPPHTRIKR